MLLTLALTALATPSIHAPEHPAPARTIVETALADGRFGTLAAALEAADLVDALQGDGPFTVLAPTDEAFAAVPAETLQALLRPENKAQLVEVLKLHVVPGRVEAAQALAAGDAKTLSGDRVHFELADGRLRVGGATVLANDVDASNGIVHVIDRVLLPQDGLQLTPRGRLVVGVYFEKPSRALASQLRVERDTTLLLTSITKDSEAQAAGLQPYDLLLTVDGHPATDAGFKQAKQRVGYGGTLTLELLRGGVPRTVEVAVGIERH